MALVNAIKKTSDIRTCDDFANAFINLLIKSSTGYEEVHLVFDRYLENSLKQHMRNKRTKGKINLLPHKRFYLNPIYFHERFPFRYKNEG